MPVLRPHVALGGEGVSTMRRVWRGVRYKLTRTRDHQYGPGKLHLSYYSREQGMWMPNCRFGVNAIEIGAALQGDTVCKECAGMIERVFSAQLTERK